MKVIVFRNFGVYVTLVLRCWLFGLFVGCLDGWLICFFNGWLVGSLVGWLFV